MAERKHAQETGQPFYFTGKPCKRGHVARRHTSNGNCVVCFAEAHRGRYAEMHRRCSREWKRRNEDQQREYLSRWRDANRERVRASVRRGRAKWASDPENKKKVNAWAAQRRAAKLLRTPAWIDRREIAAIYESCPEGYHVDHIVPLRSDRVSGLHVPWNLQVIPAIENLRKSNAV